jgi:hypothetical protein
MRNTLQPDQPGWHDANTFPSETFRVLKEKELRQLGEYRTRRLVLEAWKNLSCVSAKEYPENPLLSWR